jgi:long-chain acyl-CoA synthetase
VPTACTLRTIALFAGSCDTLAMNIALWLDRAGRSHPEQPAIMSGANLVSDFGRFARRAAALARGLGRLGLAHGDRVAIAAHNCPDYLEVLFGAWHGGFVAVPVNAKLHPAEIGWILEHSGARAAFASPNLADALSAHCPSAVTDLIVLGSPSYEQLVAEDGGPVVSRRHDDLAWLFYTSGTTGRPKGAMLTHRNLIAMSLAYLSDVDATDPGDALLHAAPMSHGSGLYSMAQVCRMAVNVIPESGGFDASEVLRLLGQVPRTSMFAAPTMLRRLVDCPDDSDARGIRTIIWGGAPMHVADVLRALERFGPRLAQIYGQGETPMTTTVLSKNDIADRDHPQWISRLASAGVANSVVEVRVADPKDRELPVGEAGEVLVRGETVMAGYWENPESTNAALRGGWLHTGDIGAFDHDGYLTLKDRSKDLIISGGTNIYPREVEEVLLTHPRVQEASVIGRPDPDWGEVVVAYVAGDVSPEELDRLCLERIARFKRPRDYVVVSALPKNSYGKILKTELRLMDRERTTQASVPHIEGSR